MKARDVFGIIIRTMGVASLVYGMWGLSFVVSSLLAGNSAWNYSTTTIPWFVSGGVLLLFGRKLVRLSYRNNKDDSEDASA